MKVGIGSKNKTKVLAVVDILKEYPLFNDAEIEGTDVHIEQFGHPKSLDETVAGAIDRAKQAQRGRDYGFGIEGGLMVVPQTKSGYMEVAACAIFDGTNVHLGLSPALEWPKKVTDLILHEGLDGSQAMKAAGLTEHEKLGEQEGLAGMLTHGRMTRTDYNKAAVMMALVHLEHPDLY
jgi:inosine/xanthosine triphosphatase